MLSQHNNGINGNKDLRTPFLNGDNEQKEFASIDSETLGYANVAQNKIKEKIQADPQRASANRAFRKLKSVKESISALDEKIDNITATIENWTVEYRYHNNNKIRIGEEMRQFRGAKSEHFFTNTLETLESAMRYLLHKPRPANENYELDVTYQAMLTDYNQQEELAKTHASNVRLLKSFKKALQEELKNLKKLEKGRNHDFTSHYKFMYRLYLVNYLLMLVDDLAFSLWLFDQSGETMDEIMDLFGRPHLSEAASDGATMPFAAVDLVYNMVLISPEDSVNSDIYAYHEKYGYIDYLASTRKYWKEFVTRVSTQPLMTTAADSFNFTAKELHNGAGALANSAAIDSLAMFKTMGWGKWALYSVMWHLGAQYYRTGYDSAYYAGLKILPQQLYSLFVTHLWQDLEFARTFTVLMRGIAAVVLRAAVFDTIAGSVLNITPSPFSWGHRDSFIAAVFIGVFWQAMGHRFTKGYSGIFGAKDALTKIFLEQAQKDDLENDGTSKVRSLLKRYNLDPAAEEAAFNTMIKDMAKIIQKNAYDKIAAKIYSTITFAELRNMIAGNLATTALTGATVGVLAGYYSAPLINFCNDLTGLEMNNLGVQVNQAIIGAGVGTLGYLASNAALMKTYMDGLVKRSLTEFKYEKEFKEYIVNKKQLGELASLENMKESEYEAWMALLSVVNTISFLVVVLDLVARFEGGISSTAKPALGIIDFVPLITMVAFLLIQQSINSYQVFFDSIKSSFTTHAERIAAIRDYFYPESTVEIEEMLDNNIMLPANDNLVADYQEEDVADIVVRNAPAEPTSVATNICCWFNSRRNRPKPWAADQANKLPDRLGFIL